MPPPFHDYLKASLLQVLAHTAYSLIMPFIPYFSVVAKRITRPRRDRLPVQDSSEVRGSILQG